jgi:hypothetical protein
MPHTCYFKIDYFDTVFEFVIILRHGDSVLRQQVCLYIPDKAAVAGLR